MNFGRLLTAMVTPFDENNRVSLEKTTELIEHLLRTKTEGLVVAGTTGESPTLSSKEKQELFQHVVKVVHGRVPVIAGTGSNNTQGSIELTQAAEAAGVDGVMLVAPYYNRPNQRGIYAHFKTIAASTSLPIMIYNVPGRTSINIEPETIVKLSQIENIKAVKEASGNLENMAKIIEQTPEDFLLYSGDDSLTLPVLAIGGDGIISVASHIIGESMYEMIDAFTEGRISVAARLHRKLLPIMKSLFAAPNPVPVKYALNKQGLSVGNVRLPLVPLTEEEQERLDAILKTL